MRRVSYHLHFVDIQNLLFITVFLIISLHFQGCAGAIYEILIYQCEIRLDRVGSRKMDLWTG